MLDTAMEAAACRKSSSPHCQRHTRPSAPPESMTLAVEGSQARQQTGPSKIEIQSVTLMAQCEKGTCMYVFMNLIFDYTV